VRTPCRPLDAWGFLERHAQRTPQHGWSAKRGDPARARAPFHGYVARSTQPWRTRVLLRAANAQCVRSGLGVKSRPVQSPQTRTRDFMAPDKQGLTPAPTYTTACHCLPPAGTLIQTESVLQECRRACRAVPHLLPWLHPRPRRRRRAHAPPRVPSFNLARIASPWLSAPAARPPLRRLRFLPAMRPPSPLVTCKLLRHHVTVGWQLQQSGICGGTKNITWHKGRMIILGVLL
jgi:hypothetical protein